MVSLSIIEYISTLFIIPIIIVSVYCLNKIGFFYDEEVIETEFKFITLSADEGKKER